MIKQKNMTITDFLKLKNLERCNVLLVKRCVRLTSYNDGKHRYFIFLYNDYFIEAQFHLKRETIFIVTAFNFEDLPEVYLPVIDFDSLIPS